MVSKSGKITPVRSPSRPQDAYHHGDLRNALVAAGVRLLNTRGMAHLTLREVALEAGVSHTAPYHHFADKTALLAAIAEVGFQQLAGLMQRDPPQPTAQDQLVAMAQCYVQFSLQHRELFRLMFNQALGDRTQYSSLHAVSKVSFNTLLSVIEQAQQRGELVGGDALHVTKTVWSLIHGWATLLVEDQIPDLHVSGVAEQTASRMLALLHGLLPVSTQAQSAPQK